MKLKKLELEKILKVAIEATSKKYPILENVRIEKVDDDKVVIESSDLGMTISQTLEVEVIRERISLLLPGKKFLSILKKLPKDKVWIFKLEQADQNYDYYLNVSRVFELKPVLSKKHLLSLKKKASYEGENVPREWSKEEMEEFEKYAADYIKLYESDVLNDPEFLSSQEGDSTSKKEC